MVKESPAEIVEKIVDYRSRLLAAVTALGGQHDIYRAVALASHNPDVNKPSRPGTGVASGVVPGPTLVTPEAPSSEAAL